MQVTPYLYFDGRCEEALKYYKKVLGAEIGMMMRFKDNPEPPAQSMVPPGSEKKIMHATFTVGGHSIMASDGMCGGAPSFQGFALSLSVKTDMDAEKLFKALKKDGQERMPMIKTFFASRFGMVADKFGVTWMVICEAPANS
jgi:PhnB protein